MSQVELFILLDRLDNLCSGAKHVPMTDLVLIDQKELRELIDRLRLSLPKEVKQVQQMARTKKQMNQQVRSEADEIITRAKQEAEKLVLETEIHKRAQQEAEKIRLEAERKAEEIRKGADQYAASVLSNLHEALKKTMDVVERGQRELAKAKPKQASPSAS